MPVFASPIYHGYDTNRYETINPDYGTNADFTRLLEDAHLRGTPGHRSIWSSNHTSAKHPVRGESSSSPAHPGGTMVRVGEPRRSGVGTAVERRTGAAGTRATAQVLTACSGRECRSQLNFELPRSVTGQADRQAVCAGVDGFSPRCARPTSTLSWRPDPDRPDGHSPRDSTTSFLDVSSPPPSARPTPTRC